MAGSFSNRCLLLEEFGEMPVLNLSKQLQEEQEASYKIFLKQDIQKDESKFKYTSTPGCKIAKTNKILNKYVKINCHPQQFSE